MASISRKKFRYLLLVVLVLSLVFYVATIFAQENYEDKLKVYYFNVGQGNGSLIRTPSGQDIIIDGGPQDNFYKQLQDVLPWNDRDIELMILTHSHEDHYKGLVGLLNNFQIKRIVLSPVKSESKSFLNFIELVNAEGAVVDILEGNKKYVFDKVSFEVFLPFLIKEADKIKNMNEGSLVTRTVFNQSEFLFPGDVEIGAENFLVKLGLNLQSDVLLSPHHGSSTSSSEDFLNLIKPFLVVISSGVNNKYHHPNEGTLMNYTKAGFEILRTDIQGGILLISDGLSVQRVPYP